MKRIFYTKDKNGRKYILFSPLGLPPYKDEHTGKWEANEMDNDAEWHYTDKLAISWLVDFSGVLEPEWEDEYPIELYIKSIKPGYSI